MGLVLLLRFMLSHNVSFFFTPITLDRSCGNGIFKAMSIECVINYTKKAKPRTKGKAPLEILDNKLG